jgi:hypothetical protein
VGLVLLVIGLTNHYAAIVWIAGVVITYGILVHTNNVAVIRRAANKHRYLRQ